VILAKVGQRSPPRPVLRGDDEYEDAPAPLDRWHWRRRALLWAALASWSVLLARMDPRVGESVGAILHGALLSFHEAGHVIFMPLGEWMAVFGGTLAQLLMPLAMAVALWRKPDRFGAALGLWFVAVSVLDIAPYMYDALHPRLVLLGGHTGEDGPHDWIYLFSSLGLLPRAQFIGLLTHRLGIALMVAALAAAAWTLWRRR